MANNLQAESVVSAGSRFVTAEVTAYGDASSHIPGCFMAIVSGSEGSQTFAEVVGGAGAVSAGVQRVTLASDDPAVVSVQLIDDAIKADDAAFTPATTKVMMAGFEYDDTTPDSVDEGDAGAARMSANRCIYVNIRDNAGNERGLNIDASGNATVNVTGTVTVGSHAVTNAGTFAVQVDGNALTALQLIDDPVFADDAAFTLASSKVMMAGAIRDDSLGTLTAIEGDAVPLRVDANGAQWVVVNGTVTVGSHAVTNAGTFAVQVDGAALTALQLIDNPVLVDDAAFTPATSSVMMAGFQADESSTDSVDEGDAGAARMTLDRKLIVTPQPHTAGGCAIFRTLDLDETEEDVKTSAGQVYGIFAINTTNAALYLKVYNATAANVTVGTTTPVMTLPVPGNNDTDGAGFWLSLPVGIAFDTAISVAATTAVADNDTGAPGANALIVQVFYK